MKLFSSIDVPFPGDLLLAEGRGPQSGMVAGNMVKAPEGLTPKGTKSLSQESLRAMPTVRYGKADSVEEILSTPKGPGVDENGELFQDAQSRHSSPGYSPSCAEGDFAPPPWDTEIDDDAESLAMGAKPHKPKITPGNSVVTPSPKGPKPENQHSVPKTTEKKDSKKKKDTNKYDKYYHQKLI